MLWTILYKRVGIPRIFFCLTNPEIGFCHHRDNIGHVSCTLWFYHHCCFKLTDMTIWCIEIDSSNSPPCYFTCLCSHISNFKNPHKIIILVDRFSHLKKYTLTNRFFIEVLFIVIPALITYICIMKLSNTCKSDFVIWFTSSL